MFSKSLTLKHSIALSCVSTLFSMGYVLHDKMDISLFRMKWNVIHSSEKEKWDQEMMMGWWPPQ